MSNGDSRRDYQRETEESLRFLRRAVFSTLYEHGRLADFQLEEIVIRRYASIRQVKDNSVRGRRNELCEDGTVRDSGLMERNSARLWCILWECTPPEERLEAEHNYLLARVVKTRRKIESQQQLLASDLARIREIEAAM